MTTVVSLLPSPVIQFSDQNGEPYANGTIGLFIPGTFTPVTTYQDWQGSVPNTQPIVLDGAGRCQIWAVGGASIRMILTDVNTNEIFDQVTTAPPGGTGALLAANNLSDLTNVVQARLNLGLGTAALANIGTSGATLGLLNANKTDSGANIFTNSNTFDDVVTLAGGARITPEANPAVNEAGYLGVPVNPQTSNYVLALTDCGKMVMQGATDTTTIPANASVAFPVGTVMALGWLGTFVGTIAITSDTLFWPGGGALTGSRTITGPGFAVVMKVAPTIWWVMGGANIA